MEGYGVGLSKECLDNIYSSTLRAHQPSSEGPKGAVAMSIARSNQEVSQPPFKEVFDLLVTTLGYRSV